MIHVCAPTEGDSEEEKNDFFEQLEEVVSYSGRHELLFVMGEFIAKIGEDEGLWRRSMKAFRIGQRNDNGQRLLEFSNISELVVTNTVFSHKNINKCTWTSQDGTTRNLIDYVLVNKIRRTSIIDTRVHSGCRFPSDQKLVILKIKYKLKAHNKEMIGKKN